MRTLGLTMSLVASAALPVTATAQHWPPPDSSVLAWIQSRVDARLSAGIVVGFVHHGRPHIIAYGKANDRGSIPLDGNTVFEIGSITKTFTTTVLADMVVRGEVRLDDPVAKYLPSTVRMPSRGGRQITLLDLATQSSGLPRLPTNLNPKDPANPYADYTVRQLYEFLASYELPRDIGAEYEYSNVGMGLLGHVLERRAGKQYEALVKERILDLLGMASTGLSLTPGLRARMAEGHDESGRRVRLWDMDVLAGAGAIRSTPNDMLMYVGATLDMSTGPLARAMALAQRSVRQIGPNMSIALGWHVLQTGSAPIVWHNGGTAGFHSFLGVQPATGANVVVLSNTASDIDDLGLHVVDQRLPLKPLPSERRAVEVDPAILRMYVGRYELSPAFTLDITKDARGLWVQATGQEKAQLFAESDSVFFLRVVDAQIAFVRDVNGAVTGLVLHQGGASSPARKVR